MYLRLYFIFLDEISLEISQFKKFIDLHNFGSTIRHVPIPKLTDFGFWSVLGLVMEFGF